MSLLAPFSCSCGAGVVVPAEGRCPGSNVVAVDAWRAAEMRGISAPTPPPLTRICRERDTLCLSDGSLLL
jgi:hypothetical protein